MKVRGTWGAAAAGWSAFILLSVALYQGVAPFHRSLDWLAQYEAVHVVAHSILYGALSALCALGCRRVPAAVVITVCVGAAQECLQCVFSPRLPGRAELFDVVVDGLAATIVALVAVHWRDLSRRATVSGTIEP